MIELAATWRQLLERPVVELVESLGRAGEDFLAESGPRFQQAVKAVRDESGYSEAMACRVVAGMARDWTRDRLGALVQAEFPDPAVLDGFAEVPAPRTGLRAHAPAGALPATRRLRALGAEVAVHIGAGSVPGVSTTSMIRSLLVKTPVLVKPGAGDRVLTALFHEALADVDPALAASAAVRYWTGGDAQVEEEVLSQARRVVFYGSDQAARELRERVPVHVPLVLYHHRSSVVVVGPELLESGGAGGEGAVSVEGVASAVAEAASTFDQRGCVSPHRVWVLGDPAHAVRMGEAVAGAMAREAAAAPPGEISDPERARVQQLRARVELSQAAASANQAAASVESRDRSGDPYAGSRVWAGPGTSWTVVVQGPDEVEASGGPRTIQIAPLPGLEALAEVLAGDGEHLQSVGVAGLGPGAPEVLELLARLGATRVCPVGEMSFPPAWWLHDGRGPLQALVRWCEWVPGV
jgi:hypothetical protein